MILSVKNDSPLISFTRLIPNKMKIPGRFLAAALFAAAICPSIGAQSESFADFRKRVLNEFNEFRSSILENYDKFLEGAWEDYDQIKGEKSNPVPKPRTAPTIGNTDAPVIQTTPVTSTPVTKPQPATKPKKPTLPVANAKPSAPVAATRQPSPEPKPESASRPAASPETTDRFNIADIPLEVPHIEYNISRRLANTQEFGAHWRGLSKTPLASQLIPAFRDLADKYGFNDYLTFMAVNAYVDARFPQAHSSSRKSLVHFLMANMGYDIRLGTNHTGTAMLLIPFNQMVFAHPYLNINGKKYFIFADEDVDLSNPDNLRISTCALPTDADTGKSLDLLITGLRLPEKPYTYNIKFGDITLTGELNQTVMPLLYHYPQMPTADFAKSTILPDVRRQIVGQLKQQLAGMDEKTAVNTLLQFVQKGFEYSTDEDFHGFEKPYFLEETLFYPKNDCEDRAIFYTYLLWEVLGIPNQLICYPGHESASVSLSTPVKGISYSHSGKTFYISDPTYIGSVTGQCMPDFEQTAPEIDFTYK